ncbi:Uncharacterized ABC transporter substrate-binding lipoprotein [Coccomyxa sp. Obi]|nr:Uncharacterized ABC transporter substrate-binding lipoprotein [Coccomyxa sp. Obi]
MVHLIRRQVAKWSVACRVVGVTDACDHPKEAASRHKVVRCSSGDALDRERERPGAQWTVDADMLSREGPGLVLASDSGHACPADAHAVAEALQRAGLCGPHSSTRLLLLGPRTLADVLESILEVGAAAGAAAEAVRVVDRLRARLRAAAAEVAAAQSRPRVMILDSLQPLSLGGLWLPEVVDLSGGDQELLEPGSASRAIAWDEVRSATPEVLLVAGNGCGPAGALGAVSELAALPGWWSLPAVKAGRVYIVDAPLLLRAGPRIVDGVEVLARILHPDLVLRRCPEKAVLKLALHGGQRCRQRLVPNYFLPFR